MKQFKENASLHQYLAISVLLNLRQIIPWGFSDGNLLQSVHAKKKIHVHS